MLEITHLRRNLKEFDTYLVIDLFRVLHTGILPLALSQAISYSHQMETFNCSYKHSITVAVADSVSKT